MNNRYTANISFESVYLIFSIIFKSANELYCAVWDLFGVPSYKYPENNYVQIKYKRMGRLNNTLSYNIIMYISSEANYFFVLHDFCVFTLTFHRWRNVRPQFLHSSIISECLH